MNEDVIDKYFRYVKMLGLPGNPMEWIKGLPGIEELYEDEYMAIPESKPIPESKTVPEDAGSSEEGKRKFFLDD